MLYQDGTKVNVSDSVIYSDGSHGKVVASFDDCEYTSEYTEKDWAYLKQGVMILSETFGLVHYPNKLEIDIRLLTDDHST